MKIHVPILEYHDLSEHMVTDRDFHSPYVLLISKFCEHMKWLYENNYTTLLIDDLFTKNIPEKSVLLTFDDGHISNYDLAFPILKEFNFVATLFIVPIFVGQENYISKDQIIEMSENGMTFGSHSLSHPYLISLNKQDIMREVIESKNRIQNLLKKKVEHFSVPYGFYNRYLVQSVRHAGYKSIVTEDFGYYRINGEPFKVLPRFTVKSQMDINIVKNIFRRRKFPLITEYMKEFFIQSLKSILGYRMYTRLKAPMLNTYPKNLE